LANYNIIPSNYSLAKLGDKNPCFAKRWINNGREHRRIALDRLPLFLANGWSEGRINTKRDPITQQFITLKDS
jgi:hypothetical protein